MNELNKTLRDSAIALGLCKQWQADWNQDWDVDKMADKFWQGINFCVKNHYPDKDFIVNTFDKNTLRGKCIIADDKYSLLNPSQALIIGNSQSTIRYNALASGRIHIQHDSAVTLTAKGRSRVIAHVWDRAHLNVQRQDVARVLVVLHSPYASVTHNGDIEVKQRFGND